MRDEDSPLSVYFDIVDKCLSEGHAVTRAMIIANNQMGVMQQQRRVFPNDVFLKTMKGIEYMIKRRPDYADYDVSYA
jgi:hypothetical protein